MTNHTKRNKIFCVSQRNIFKEYESNLYNFQNENIIDKYQLKECANEIKIVTFNFSIGNHNFINNFINFQIATGLLEKDNTTQIEKINKMYKNNNSAFVIKCFKTLFEFFEFNQIKTLYNNCIFQIDKKERIHYFSEEQNEILKKDLKELKADLKQELNQFDYAVIIIPDHLRLNCRDIFSFFSDEMNQEYIEKNYSKEIIEKMLNVYKKDNNNKYLTKKIAQIIKNSTSKVCQLTKGEQVYVDIKTRFKERFRVITQQGNLAYATKSQLQLLPDLEQTQELKDSYLQARKNVLLKEEETGYPVLFTIKFLERGSSFIYGITSDNLKMYIPKKIVPSLHFSKLKEGDTIWITIPSWYFEKFIKNHTSSKFFI
jgi:hypothetical protein